MAFNSSFTKPEKKPFKNKEGRGALWPAKEKLKETSPDFNGVINIGDGEGDRWLNAWKAEDGSRINLSIGDKKPERDAAPAKDDELPW